uniref:GDSL esterase/lipase n=1 Tax=Kalanchoe fedtschenkoi TaxID=63787 RepID=A0A7N0U326_KALFE
MCEREASAGQKRSEALGCKSAIPTYLNPTLTQAELLSGVNFASVGSGYDELTAYLINVLALPDQLDYFQQYKNRLRLTVGSQEADEVINRTVFLLSIGTNDFLMNYYINPKRQAQFSVEQYQDFLVLKMVHTVESNWLLLVGLPPIVRTLHRVSQGCFDEYKEVAASFNRKVKKALLSLGLGCCGTGRAEFGETCRGLTTCADLAKYVFWDAIHPTEKLCRIAADDILSQISGSFPGLVSMANFLI